MGEGTWTILSTDRVVLQPCPRKSVEPSPAQAEKAFRRKSAATPAIVIWQPRPDEKADKIHLMPDAAFFRTGLLRPRLAKRADIMAHANVLPHLRTDKAVLCPPHIAPAFTRLSFRPPMAWAENALAFRTVARSRRGNRAGGSWAATIWIATLLRPEWVSRLET